MGVVSYRELAFQISEQFEALGGTIGVKCGMIMYMYLWLLIYFNYSCNCRRYRYDDTISNIS